MSIDELKYNAFSRYGDYKEEAEAYLAELDDFDEESLDENTDFDIGDFSDETDEDMGGEF